MLRNGFQKELLLLIADNRPMGRHDMEMMFSGDACQRKNTLYSLKQKGLILLGLSGYDLTAAGEKEACRLMDDDSAKAAAKEAKQPKKATPSKSVLFVSPSKSVEPGISTAQKISVLQQCAQVVNAEWAAVLNGIRQELENANA